MVLEAKGRRTVLTIVSLLNPLKVAYFDTKASRHKKKPLVTMDSTFGKQRNSTGKIGDIPDTLSNALYGNPRILCPSKLKQKRMGVDRKAISIEQRFRRVCGVVRLISAQ